MTPRYTVIGNVSATEKRAIVWWRQCRQFDTDDSAPIVPKPKPKPRAPKPKQQPKQAQRKRGKPFSPLIEFVRDMKIKESRNITRFSENQRIRQCIHQEGTRRGIRYSVKYNSTTDEWWVTRLT